MFSDRNIANKGMIGQLSFGLGSYPDSMTITKRSTEGHCVGTSISAV